MTCKIKLLIGINRFPGSHERSPIIKVEHVRMEIWQELIADEKCYISLGMNEIAQC